MTESDDNYPILFTQNGLIDSVAAVEVRQHVAHLELFVTGCNVRPGIRKFQKYISSIATRNDHKE